MMSFSSHYIFQEVLFFPAMKPETKEAEKPEEQK